MNKLKVDYVVGKWTGEVNSLVRYASEIMRGGGDEIDGRLISHNRELPLPGLRRLPGITTYPFTVRKDARPTSIKHICSHIQAHLLNYLDLRPAVVSCMDVYALEGEEYPRLDRKMMAYSFRGLLKADRIISISQFTKNKLLGLFEYREDHIHVIPLGVDHARYYPQAQREALRGQYGLPRNKRIILYVGSEQPRKNLPTLIKAFAALRKERDDVTLVKVGRPQSAEGRKRVMETIGKQRLERDVFFIDYAAEQDLPGIYNAVDVFVFPSRYEGFGLPPLEAMACGCPVIASNAASLPEVLGNAAILCQPDDVASLAEQMGKVLTDEAMRDSLISRGLARAAEFDWNKTAGETLKVYHEFV